jgi:hypothetical protein
VLHSSPNAATSLAGKLAAEYLKEKQYPVKWGVCGRNAEKVKDVLGRLGVECPVEVADLVGLCLFFHALQWLRPLTAAAVEISPATGRRGGQRRLRNAEERGKEGKGLHDLCWSLRKVRTGAG